jgi:hypothetical protein
MTRRIPFDPDQAERVIQRMLAGDMLRDLWRDPTLPSRHTLKEWRRANPDFEASVRAAANFARSERWRTRSPYDARTRAEVCRRARLGLTMREITSDPHMPSWSTLFWWLRSEHDFAWDFAAARDEWIDEQLPDRAFCRELLDGLTRENVGERTRARIGAFNLQRRPRRYTTDVILKERLHRIWPIEAALHRLRRRNEARRRRARLRALARARPQPAAQAR